MPQLNWCVYMALLLYFIGIYGLNNRIGAYICRDQCDCKAYMAKLTPHISANLNTPAYMPYLSGFLLAFIAISPRPRCSGGAGFYLPRPQSRWRGML